MSSPARAINAVVVPGVCRVCGCTDMHGCTLEDGSPCDWYDPAHTLCDNPRCVGPIPLMELAEIYGGLR